MDDLSDKDVVNAARAALNNAIRRGRVKGTKLIKNRVNLKATEIKKRIKVERSTGGILKKLNAALVFSGDPISMRNFVVGKKSTIDQKGIAVKKRRVLKARVKHGQKIILAGAFLQRGASGNKQVFRHRAKGRRLRKISTKSLAKIILEEKINVSLKRIVTVRMEREFRRQIQWRWEKSYSKFNKKPMRKF